MLIEIIMSLAAVLIAICGVVTYKQVKGSCSGSYKDQVAESMAGRSSGVLLQLADAYQLPDSIGMDKVQAIRDARQAVLDYESDFFLAVEEMETENKRRNVSVLRTRFWAGLFNFKAKFFE